MRHAIVGWIGAMAMVCCLTPQVSGSVFPDSRRVELTPEERASLDDPAPEWFDELPQEDQDEEIVRRGDEDIRVVRDEDGQAAGFTGTKWTDGIVYYQFNANVNGTNQQRFRDAAAEWSAVADLTFIESTGTGDYIEVRDDTGNSSFVGRIGGRQILRMFNWSRKYIIVHEIGHALGLRHEHSRSDRDAFVTIITENIEEGREHNFNRHSTTNYGTYDFESVMHYRRNAFLRAGLSSSSNTIEPTPPYADQLNVMGQRDALSDLDKQGMADHYGGVAASPEIADRGAIYHGLGATSVAPGGLLTIQGEVHNSGTSRAGVFFVDFYASTNTNIATTDHFLGRKPIPGLAEGESASLETTVTLSAAIPQGTYYIGWILDSTFTVVERDESNNTVHIAAPRLTITTAPSGPIDLQNDETTFQVLAPPTVRAGTPLTVLGGIRNGGTTLSGSFETEVYLSTNSVISGADTLLGTVQIPTVVGGSRAIMNLASALVPYDLNPGSYYVGWIIDASDVVQETDEFNNTVVYSDGNALLTVLDPPPPQIDLVQGIVADLPSQLNAGDAFTFSSSVSNGGFSPSGGFNIAFYLSTDTFIDAGTDAFLGSTSIPSIDGLSSHPYSTQLTVPSDASAGTYYVGWILDSGNVVTEINESNNAGYLPDSRSVQTAPDIIDLRDEGEQRHHLSPTTVEGGGQVTVRCEVRNAGTATAGSYAVKFYLSTNTIISSGDTLIGTATVDSHASGSALDVDVSDATVPAGLSSGVYYVGWRIDADSAIDETDESNNAVLLRSGSTRLTVTAPISDVDLRDEGDHLHSVSSRSIPLGGSISVEFGIRNGGVAPSASFDVGLYLSTNTTISPADTLIGEQRMTGIPGNQILSVSFSDVALPPDLSVGDYHLGWIIDSGSELDETNESNNRVLFKSGAEPVSITPSADFRFVITLFRRLPSEYEVTFASVAGKTYRVTTSTDLDNWSAVAGQIGIPGTGAAITRTVPHAVLPSHPLRYFRVEEE